MDYWLDLFTGTTWKEFRQSGSRVSGFRPRMRNASSRVKPGDVFLCYLTGVSRWVGALEVVGPSDSKEVIWGGEEFPVRFEVKPFVQLEPEHGIPMEDFNGKLDFFRGPQDRGKFKGFIRMSPNKFVRESDGELILNMLMETEQNPIARPVDQKKLDRKPTYRVTTPKKPGPKKAAPKTPQAELKLERVTIPPPNDSEACEDAATSTRHTEMQYLLLELGAEMGLDVWVARNDRRKEWNGKTLGEMPRLLEEIPTQFNDKTNRTIEMIDVLWLSGHSIAAAFEIECTTSIYSGLLRMSDLLALQPNLNIRLYLVAPEVRRNKVQSELLRPTFIMRKPPLGEVCGFLGMNALAERITTLNEMGIAGSMKTDFLEKSAEHFAKND